MSARCRFCSRRPRPPRSGRRPPRSLPLSDEPGAAPYRAASYRRNEFRALARADLRLELLGRRVLVEVRVVPVNALRRNVVQHGAKDPNRESVQELQLRFRHLPIGFPGAQDGEYVRGGRRQGERIDPRPERRGVDDDDLETVARPTGAWQRRATSAVPDRGSTAAVGICQPRVGRGPKTFVDGDRPRDRIGEPRRRCTSKTECRSPRRMSPSMSRVEYPPSERHRQVRAHDRLSHRPGREIATGVGGAQEVGHAEPEFP